MKRKQLKHLSKGMHPFEAFMFVNGGWILVIGAAWLIFVGIVLSLGACNE